MLTVREFGRYPWSVVDDLLSMQDGFNQLLDGRYRASPPVNVWHSSEELVVDVMVPGIEPPDVDIEVKGSVLTVSGKRPAAPVGEEQYVIREREQGPFSRSLNLPYRVEGGKVQATYRNGVLRITLPRAEEDKPRRIAIEAER